MEGPHVKSCKVISCQIKQEKVNIDNRMRLHDANTSLVEKNINRQFTGLKCGMQKGDYIKDETCEVDSFYTTETQRDIPVPNTGGSIESPGLNQVHVITSERHVRSFLEPLNVDKVTPVIFHDLEEKGQSHDLEEKGQSQYNGKLPDIKEEMQVEDHDEEKMADRTDMDKPCKVIKCRVVQEIMGTNEYSLQPTSKTMSKTEDMVKTSDAASSIPVQKKDYIKRIRTKQYRCTKCTSVFQTLKTKNFHINNRCKVHRAATKSGLDHCYVKRYTNSVKTKKKRRKTYSLCDRCGVLYPNEALKEHYLIHSEEKPFKCDEANCNAAFARSQNLRLHAHIHTGEKSFVCTICNSRYARKHSLTRHMQRMHQNDRFRYLCDECPERFRQEYLLKMHKQVVHTGELLYEQKELHKCIVCNSYFANATHLAAHEKIHYI